MTPDICARGGDVAFVEARPVVACWADSWCCSGTAEGEGKEGEDGEGGGLHCD